MEGNKTLLGLWIGKAEAEGAKLWLKVLTDLKNRGLKDILIACVDGLTGFPQAIEAVYPDNTQVQLCIVHLIRNCLRYVPWKDSKVVVADLKSIYSDLAPGNLNDNALLLSQRAFSLNICQQQGISAFEVISRALT